MVPKLPNLADLPVVPSKSFSDERFAQLVNEIRTLEDDLHAGLRTDLEKAAAIGERLEEIKQELPHGAWQPFLKASGISKTRAWRYRKITQQNRDGRFPTGHTTIEQFATVVKKARKAAADEINKEGTRTADTPRSHTTTEHTTADATNEHTTADTTTVANCIRAYRNLYGVREFVEIMVYCDPSDLLPDTTEEIATLT